MSTDLPMLGSILDWAAVMPVIVLAVGALFLLIADLCRPSTATISSESRVQSLTRTWWCITICVCAGIVSWPGIELGHLAQSSMHLPAAYLHGSVYADAFSFVFNILILGSTILYFLLRIRQDGGPRIRDTADVDILVLLATIGAIAFVHAGDLIVLFIGLELLSISVYVLTGLARREKASSEAALKYFMLGAFSSAFFLYGAALVYGATGSMQLGDISLNTRGASPMLLLGSGLMLFGFAFKIGLFPFHLWVPDVYQGAPTSITVYMASVVKISAIGAMLRVVVIAFSEHGLAWQSAVWAMAVGSMIVGNFGALRQRSVKRMLAYSSIAHAGYLFMGLLALGASEGGEAIIYYAFVYGIMTIATFGVVLLLSSGSEWQYERDDVSVFAGLGWRSPLLGLVMAVGLFSLAGLPPFAGFIGKLYLFKAVINEGYWGIAIIAALNSLVSLYYYLRVIVVMYFGDAARGERLLLPEQGTDSRLYHDKFEASWGPSFVVGFAGFLIVAVGLFSGSLLQIASQAIHSL